MKNLENALNDESLDIAQWCLEKIVTRMKRKTLRGQKLEKMKLLEGALTNIQLARFIK